MRDFNLSKKLTISQLQEIVDILTLNKELKTFETLDEVLNNNDVLTIDTLPISNRMEQLYGDFFIDTKKAIWCKTFLQPIIDLEKFHDYSFYDRISKEQLTFNTPDELFAIKEKINYIIVKNNNYQKLISIRDISYHSFYPIYFIEMVFNFIKKTVEEKININRNTKNKNFSVDYITQYIKPNEINKIDLTYFCDEIEDFLYLMLHPMIDGFLKDKNNFFITEKKNHFVNIKKLADFRAMRWTMAIERLQEFENEDE